MITYIHGQASGSFRKGDIVFLAGNPDCPDPPAFEHVALVAGDCDATSFRDVLRLVTYGLPESLGSPEKDSTTDEEELVPYTVRHYEMHFAVTTAQAVRPVGHPESGWNLAARPSIGRVQAEQMVMAAGRAIAKNRVTFSPGRYPSRETAGVHSANCLGFVCDLYARFGGQELLYPEFPPYVPGFKPGARGVKERSYPAPSHLAAGLNERVIPFGEGISKTEAEAKSLAKYVIQGKLAS